MPTFGDKLKQMRVDKGMLQRDLAEKLNVSISTISQYESDTKRPRMKTLEEIAKIFGVTVDYLVGYTEKTNATNIDELEFHFPEGVKVLRRATNDLTPEQRQKMIELMEWFLNSEEKKK